MQLATQIGINSATTPLGGSAPPPIAIGQQQQPQPKGPQSAPVQTRDYAALHLEVFELVRWVPKGPSIELLASNFAVVHFPPGEAHPVQGYHPMRPAGPGPGP